MRRTGHDGRAENRDDVACAVGASGVDFGGEWDACHRALGYPHRHRRRRLVSPRSLRGLYARGEDHTRGEGQAFLFPLTGGGEKETNVLVTI